MDGMTIRLGSSVERRPIEAFTFGPKGVPTLLVLAGFHGDEPIGVSIARNLMTLLLTPDLRRSNLRWVVVPEVNRDGYAKRRRRNAREVDINRNFPTHNWTCGPRRSRMFGGDAPGSEPETRAVIRAVTRFAPAAIITIHSISHGRHCNNYDGPGRKLAATLNRHNRYPVTASIGYPTPGSFGAWAGTERAIPTITLELPTTHSLKRCWAENRAAFLAAGRLIASLAEKSARPTRRPTAAR
jgi:protein MpaA